MEVMLWFAGMFATFYGIKIIFKFMSKVYKRLTCEEGGIDGFLDNAEQKMNQTADKVANKLKKKKENRPVVTIR